MINGIEIARHKRNSFTASLYMEDGKQPMIAFTNAADLIEWMKEELLPDQDEAPPVDREFFERAELKLPDEYDQGSAKGFFPEDQMELKEPSENLVEKSKNRREDASLPKPKPDYPQLVASFIKQVMIENNADWVLVSYHEAGIHLEMNAPTFKKAVDDGRSRKILRTHKIKLGPNRGIYYTTNLDAKVPFADENIKQEIKQGKIPPQTNSTRDLLHKHLCAISERSGQSTFQIGAKRVANAIGLTEMTVRALANELAFEGLMDVTYSNGDLVINVRQ